MAEHHILICDHCPDFFLTKLRTLNFSIDYRPAISNAEIETLDNRYSAVLIKSAMVLNRAFFDHFSQINLVLRPGSGLDNVDLVHCEKKGIRVINSPGGNSNAVGEHALGLLLMMSNNMFRAIEEVRNGQWVREENRGFEIEGKSIGVIGVGNAGSAFCKKLEGLAPVLLPHDKYKPWISTIQQASVSLDEVFEGSDIVSLHLPLTKETDHYANDVFFESFKKPIYFLNTSRGGVVDIDALYRAIENGRVLMAALDVLETEPLERNSKAEMEVIGKLQGTGKVLITPHIAGWTHEAKVKMFQILLDSYQGNT